ncbi:MAG TPA: metalloregulator ArsR/SmtB family transcription factor [Armatimonadota bacterium]|jgi:ArsR family transcriptional regulator
MTERLIDYAALEAAAPVIRGAAHPMRLRILDFLHRAARPRSVADIVLAAGAAPSAVSQQLRILKDLGLLSCRRSGHHVLYSISNPRIIPLLSCIEADCAEDPRPAGASSPFTEENQR